MKTLRFISTFAMLALATVVTAGSLYVTASAAAQQESTDFDLVGSEAAQVPAVVDAVSSHLDKSSVLNNSQSHVILDENGGFSGRLSSLSHSDGRAVAAANLKVRLAQHGSIIGSTTTDAHGRFSFSGLPEGVVAICAEGEDILLLSGFVLFGPDTMIPENAGLVAAQLDLDIDSAVASGADVAFIKELIASKASSTDLRFKGPLTAADQEYSFGSGDPSSIIRHDRVVLGGDGSLRGEVGVLDERTGRVREVHDLTLYFVRNGILASSTVVELDGSFNAKGLTPGIYSVAAVGSDGVMVWGAEVVGTTDEGNTVKNATGEFTPVNIVTSSLMLAGGVGGSPAGSENAGAFGYGGGGGSGGGGVAGATPGAGGPAPGAGGGPFGGGGGGPTGGGGGGGPFGGGGGLGALLAGGIGGAIGYLIGDNNNDKPASPGI